MVKKSIMALLLMITVTMVLMVGCQQRESDDPPPGDTEPPFQGWQWTRLVDAAAYNLNDMVFTGELYVAVGQDGIIKTSVDGVHWDIRKSGTVSDLNSIAWNGSNFVVVGDRETVLISEDGINWSATVVADQNVRNLRAVVWGDNQFLAVNENAWIYASTDGIVWSRIHIESSKFASKLIWTGDQYVMAGTYYLDGDYLMYILTSVDGQNWTTHEIPFGDENVVDLNYFKGNYIITTSWQVLVSDDLENWSIQERGSNLNKILAAEDYCLVFGFEGHGLVIYRSVDGKRYTRLDVDLEDDVRHINAAAITPEGLLAVGDQGVVLRSPNLEDWDHQNLGLNPNHLWGIASNGNAVVAVGHQTVMYSKNGFDWQVIKDQVERASHVVWTGQEFILAGTNVVYISNDGLEWELSSSWHGLLIRNLVIIDDRIFAVGGEGGQGVILESSDGGASWQKVTPGIEGYITGMTAGDSGWVLTTSQPGGIYRSDDGNNWTPTSVTDFLTEVIWTGSNYLAAGGILLSSEDGLSWTKLPNVEDILSLTHAELGVAVGHWGTIMTLEDENPWKRHPRVTSSPLYGVVIHQGKIIAVGTNGTIVVGEYIE